MRRPQTLLALIFICFSSISTLCQDIGFGVLGGPNFYTIRRESNGDVIYDGTSAKQNLKYHFGAFVDVNFSSNLGVVGNVVYQNRTISLEPDTQFNYLDFNPLLKFDVNQSYGNGFYLKGGFRYSVLLSAKTVEGDIDVQDAFKSSNIGLVGGFGLDVSSFLGLEVLVDYSPMNIVKDVDGASVTSRLVGGNFRLVFYIEKVLNNR